MRVLVVDDSATMRRIERKVLAKCKCEDVVEARNGVQAVELAEDKEVKLILMDWNLPEMNGLDAVKAIRAKGNKVAIIMVTTEAEKKRVIEAVQAGINDYLVKPFTPKQLAAKIKKFTGGASS